MLVHDSGILQVAIFGALKDHFNHLDRSFLLPDVMTIADEVDAQLTQSMLYGDDRVARCPRLLAGQKPSSAWRPDRASWATHYRS
jgi:hypothetical protein